MINEREVEFMSNTTVFNSVHTVAKYLHYFKKDISPLKLQKSLYFLFAYHGALHGKQIKEGVFEGTSNIPEYLFDAEFEAWKYGPVIREVYAANKQNDYTDENIAEAVREIESKHEVKHFIDELFKQIDSVSDFGLVDRSHQDDVWKNAYKNGTTIDKELIIGEYIERYVTE
jgi:uncharacterized phage-associated protein